MARFTVLVVVLIVLTTHASACSPEQGDMLRQELPTLQAAGTSVSDALQTAAPTLAAVASQVVGGLQTAAPTLEAVGSSVAAGVQTAAPTIQAAGTQLASGIQTAVPTIQAGGGRAADALVRVARSLRDLEAYGLTWWWRETTAADGTVLAPADSKAYSIAFTPGGQVKVRADCNTLAGTATGQDGALAIQLDVTTLVACPEGSLADAFLAGVRSVSGVAMEGTDLLLETDAGTMRFSPSAVAAP